MENKTAKKSPSVLKFIQRTRKEVSHAKNMKLSTYQLIIAQSKGFKTVSSYMSSLEKKDSINLHPWKQIINNKAFTPQQFFSIAYNIDAFNDDISSYQALDYCTANLSISNGQEYLLDWFLPEQEARNNLSFSIGVDGDDFFVQVYLTKPDSEREVLFTSFFSQGYTELEWDDKEEKIEHSDNLSLSRRCKAAILKLGSIWDDLTNDIDKDDIRKIYTEIDRLSNSLYFNEPTIKTI